MAKTVLTTLPSGPVLEYTDSFGRTLNIRVFEERKRFSISMRNDAMSVVIGLQEPYAKEIANFLSPLTDDFLAFRWRNAMDELPPMHRPVLVCYRHGKQLRRDVMWRIPEECVEAEWSWFNDQQDCEYCDPSVVLAWSELPQIPDFVTDHHDDQTA